MDRISVFVISNQFLFRSGLENLLRQEVRYEILGEADDIEQAIELIKKLQPAVMILDDTSPSKDNTSAAIRLLAINPTGKVIGLNLRNNQLNIYKATQVVVKSVHDLLEAIEAVDPLAKPTLAKSK